MFLKHKQKDYTGVVLRIFFLFNTLKIFIFAYIMCNRQYKAGYLKYKTNFIAYIN